MLGSMQGERLQLDGGSRPGPSWSLLLNLPVLTAVAMKLFLVPAPATPTARPTCHQRQGAARLRCRSCPGLWQSNLRLRIWSNRASIRWLPGQDQLRCRTTVTTRKRLLPAPQRREIGVPGLCLSAQRFAAESSQHVGWCGLREVEWLVISRCT